MRHLHHGGGLDTAIAIHGGSRDSWLDFSTGINPRGWPVPDIDPGVWQRLPDHGLREALSHAARDYYSVNGDFDIHIGNGTQSIIQILPRFLGSELTVKIVGPTYEEHFHCWQSQGHQVAYTDGLAGLVNESCDVGIVVNPNNPDGKRWTPEEIIHAAERLNGRGGFLIVDEAFADVDPEGSVAGSGQKNIIVLKSLGKFFGLAGVRLGFAISTSEIIAQLDQLAGPWATSGPALYLGTLALQDRHWIETAREWIEEASQRQADMLTRLGFDLVANIGLFMMITTPHAKAIELGLKSRHILVRDFEYQNQWIRFGLCKSQDERNRLRNALSDILSECGEFDG